MAKSELQNDGKFCHFIQLNAHQSIDRATPVSARLSLSRLRFVGNWVVDVTFHHGTEVRETTATALGVTLFDRFVELYYFQADGFAGRALFNFNEENKTFQATWIGNTTVAQYHEIGTCSTSAGGCMELQCSRITKPVTGEQMHELVWRFIDPNSIEYRAWYGAGTSKEKPTMIALYKRV